MLLLTDYTTQIMNNYTNIYDIDGNIIRKAGDNHRFTIEEVEKLVDDLTAKVQENPDNQVYRVYLNNAHKWLYNMYNNMSTKDLAKRISMLQDAVQTAKDNATEAEQKNLEELNGIIDNFKQQYESNVDTDVESSVGMHEQPKPDTESVDMEEYVEPIEEIKDDTERGTEEKEPVVTVE